MKWKMTLVVLIIASLAFLLYQQLFNDQTHSISAEKAETIAVELYGGKVLHTVARDADYQIELENEKGRYMLFIDAHTERVYNVQLIEKKETVMTAERAKRNIEQDLDGNVLHAKEFKRNGKPFMKAIVEKGSNLYSVEYDLLEQQITAKSETKNHAEAAPVTMEEAEQIALKRFKGSVAGVSKATTEKGPHYIVTIEGDKESASIYVQSNTGLVTSTFWKKLDDDDDDLDDQDDPDDDDDAPDQDDAPDTPEDIQKQ